MRSPARTSETTHVKGKYLTYPEKKEDSDECDRID